MKKKDKIINKTSFFYLNLSIFFMIGCANDFFIESKKSIKETVQDIKNIYRKTFKKNEIIKENEKMLIKLLKNTKRIKLYKKYFFIKKNDIKYFLNPKYFVAYKLPFLYKDEIERHYHLFRVDIEPRFITYMLYLSNKIIIKNIQNLYPFYLVNGKIFKYDNIKENSFIINNKKIINYILKNKEFYFAAGTMYFPKDIEVYIYAPDDEKYEKVKKLNKKIQEINKKIFKLKLK